MPFVPALIGAGVAAYGAYKAAKPEDGPGLTGGGDGSLGGGGSNMGGGMIQPADRSQYVMPDGGEIDPRGLVNGGIGDVHQQRSDAYNYGGAPGLAQGEMGNYQNASNNWRDLRAPDISYAAAQMHEDRGNAARMSQGDALGMYRDAAMGNAPSRAELMMRQGAAQNAATQTQMAAGARGPAALAMAQQQAAANTSMGNAQIASNAGMMRADEIAQARNAYGGMANQMRGQDAQYMDSAAQRMQAQAQLGMGYRQMGQSGQLSYDQMRAGVLHEQGQARMGYQQQNDNRAIGQAGTNQQSRANDINTGAQVINGIATAAKMSGG